MTVRNTPAERRALRRKAWQHELDGGLAPEKFSHDPMARRRAPTWQDVLVLTPLALFAAVGAHVVFTAVVWGAGVMLGVEDEEVVDTVGVVVMQEVEPEPEPEPEKEPEPEPEPEPEKEPVAKPPPKTPPPKPKPEPEAKPPPPSKIVGLDLGSTVAGGGGPAFAVGDDLLGTTDRTAQDPNAKPKPDVAPPSPEKAAPNRKATRIPQEGVKLVKPSRRSRVKPKYPADLRAQGIEGNVVVQVRLGKAGEVLDVEIVSPSPYPEMNTQALAAARLESFSPATRDGVPIEFTLSYTIRFRLSDS